MSAVLAWAQFTSAFSDPGELLRYGPGHLRRVVLWGVAVAAGTVNIDDGVEC